MRRGEGQNLQQRPVLKSLNGEKTTTLDTMAPATDHSHTDQTFDNQICSQNTQKGKNKEKPMKEKEEGALSQCRKENPATGEGDRRAQIYLLHNFFLVRLVFYAPKS